MAADLTSRARAILWAQWRNVVNHLPHANAAAIAFSVLLGIVWYGGFTALAFGAALLLSSPAEIGAAQQILPGALLLGFLYWQVVPLLLVSTGAALDIKKLIVYPIPHRELFGLEVLLRLSTGIEVVLVLLGACAGLLLNPKVPFWAPLSLLLFMVFNLFVAAGVRDVISRLMARKGIREVIVFLFVLAAGLPQLMLYTGAAHNLRTIATRATGIIFPWNATANLALGRFSLAGSASLIGWTLAAYLFGRWQFERGLRFDEQEAAAKGNTSHARSRLEGFFRFPGALFADPLGVLVEKELRFLSRSSRFRLVFLMGFSFGLLIWLPMAFRNGTSTGSWFSQNYLSLISAYALLLLSDVLFWNIFGFDRSAAQIYFVAPVKMRTVLLAKNVAAMIFVLLEVSLIALICAALRFPVTLNKLAEAYLITFTSSLFFMAVGNLSSVYSPKATDPAKSFRHGAARQTQAVLMLFFPVSLFPAILAYAARYAFETEWAFYAVLLFSALLGLITYSVSAESAIAATEHRREAIITALSGGAGLISS